MDYFNYIHENIYTTNPLRFASGDFLRIITCWLKCFIQNSYLEKLSFQQSYTLIIVSRMYWSGLPCLIREYVCLICTDIYETLYFTKIYYSLEHVA
jgi:hypothetical protein